MKGGRPTKPRASKSQIKRAREQLAEAKQTRSAKTFSFFDEDAGYQGNLETVGEDPAAPEPEVEPPHVEKRRFGRRNKHEDPETSKETSTEPSETPVSAQDASDTSHPASPPPPNRGDAAAEDDEPERVAGNAARRATPATALIESGGLWAMSPTAPDETSEHSEDSDLTSAEPARSASDSHISDSHTSDSHTQDSHTSDRQTSESHVSPPSMPRSSLASRLHSGSAARATTEPAPTTSTNQPSESVEAAVVPPATQTQVPPPAVEPQSEDHDASPDLDTDPFATPEYSGVTIPDVHDPAPHIDLSFPTPTNSKPSSAVSGSFNWQSTTNDDLANDPFGSGNPFSSAATQDDATQNDAAQNGTAQVDPTRDDTTRDDTTLASEPPTAPAPDRRAAATGQVTTGAERAPTTSPQHRPEPQQHVPAAPTPTPAAPRPERQAPTVVAASAPTGSATATVEEAPPASADTDTNGNWIPPVLRGMAPVVERRADPLPRRREKD